MRSWSVALLVLVGSSMMTSGVSATPQTVGDLIAACDSQDALTQQEQCHQVFLKMYGAALETELSWYRGPRHRFCLPALPSAPVDQQKGKQILIAAAAEYEAKVLAYLRGQPTMRDEATVRGLTDATLAVYACQDGQSGG